MTQMKEQIKTPEKAKRNGDKQSIRCGVQNIGYKDTQGTWDLSSIKKIQSKSKNSLIERQNNLQGNNSKVDKTENQINVLEHKEAKNNHTEQQEEKNNPKKNEDNINSLWDNFKRSNIHSPHRSARRRRDRARNWKSI